MEHHKLEQDQGLGPAQILNLNITEIIARTLLLRSACAQHQLTALVSNIKCTFSMLVSDVYYFVQASCLYNFVFILLENEI